MNSNRMISSFGAANEEVTFGLFERVQIACDVIGKNPAVQAMTHFGKAVGANFKALARDAAEIAMGCFMGAGIKMGTVILADNAAVKPGRVHGLAALGLVPTPA